MRSSIEINAEINEVQEDLKYEDTSADPAELRQRLQALRKELRETETNYKIRASNS